MTQKIDTLTESSGRRFFDGLPDAWTPRAFHLSADPIVEALVSAILDRARERRDERENAVK